jgi:hypothetical protein
LSKLSGIRKNTLFTKPGLSKWIFTGRSALRLKTPRERIEILRAAFAKTLEDPELLKEVKKTKLVITAVSGGKVESSLVKSLICLPTSPVGPELAPLGEPVRVDVFESFSLIRMGIVCPSGAPDVRRASSRRQAERPGKTGRFPTRHGAAKRNLLVFLLKP